MMTPEPENLLDSTFRHRTLANGVGSVCSPLLLACLPAEHTPPLAWTDIGAVPRDLERFWKAQSTWLD